jgi:hypothetical protein
MPAENTSDTGTVATASTAAAMDEHALSQAQRAVSALAATRRHIDETIRQHQQSLLGWAEPGGFLLPTEPDPKEREAIRIQLMAAIDTLKKVDSHILALTGGC